MKVSFSRLGSAAHCLRQYELRYVEGLEKKPSLENEGRILGSAIHAGFDAALVFWFNHYKDGSWDVYVENWVNIAVKAAQNYVLSQAAGVPVDTPVEYFDMIESVRLEAAAFVKYYLPRMGFGNRYVPVSVSEVLPQYMEAHVPFVEYDFELPLDSGDILVGRVDAVLRDLTTGELILVDWKSRVAFPADYLADIDDQLHLYAAAINANGGNISQVAMMQMKRGLPKGAEFSTKDGLPLTGRASYNATWESFYDSLPAGIDAEHYRPLLEGKLKRHEPDFFHPVFGYVTETSSMLVLENMAKQINVLLAAQRADEFPARMSYTACQFCEFKRLCSSFLRYGGDGSEMIALDFQKRDRSAVVEEMAVSE